MGTLANSEYPDEMPPIAAFHQGLHCFAKTKSTKKYGVQYFFGNYNL